MKKVEIYKKQGEFVVKRTNEFNHATKRSFITEQGLLEHLNDFKRFQDLDKYEIEVDDELWALVLNELQRE